MNPMIRHGCVAFAILLSGASFAPEPAVAEVLFKADFETGDFSQFAGLGKNIKPGHIGVVTDVVHSGKYAGRFTIHEDDVFNPRQLRVQANGPRVTVREGSDTNVSSQTKGPQTVDFSQPGIHRDPHTRSADTLYFDDILCATTLEEVEIRKPGEARSEAPSGPRFKAVAFDYFVLFDPNSVVPAVEEAFPGKGAEFTRAWRAKQFEYGFLRSITDRHADFFKVTEDALVYTAATMKLDLPLETRKRLLDAYLTLKPWPDAVDALRRLKASGVRVITIANFSHEMLRANAENAGIVDLFDELLSTEVNRTYKPDPRAYALGMERLKLKKEEIVFAAFGGWDAYGAKSFGYTTCWVNRLNLPVEELGITPDVTSNNLEGLLKLVLGRP